MTRVRYTRDAEQDLLDIAQYTIETWGKAQAARYLDLLEQTCERILPEHGHLGRSIPKRPSLRAWRCERHIVYFHESERGIEIVRILHERMLPENYL